MERWGGVSTPLGAKSLRQGDADVIHRALTNVVEGRVDAAAREATEVGGESHHTVHLLIVESGVGGEMAGVGEGA